jgi:hypothetical protein
MRSRFPENISNVTETAIVAQIEPIVDEYGRAEAALHSNLAIHPSRSAKT